MIWPPKGPKLNGSTAGPSMNLTPCCGVVVSARCTTCGPSGRLSIVKTRPFSHPMIILLPNVPTLSNVIELWSERGQPPFTPAQLANGMKTPLGGVALRTDCSDVTKTSPGLNPATADSAGAIAVYFSTKSVLLTIVPKNEPFPRLLTLWAVPFSYWLTTNRFGNTAGLIGRLTP